MGECENFDLDDDLEKYDQGCENFRKHIKLIFSKKKQSEYFQENTIL